MAINRHPRLRAFLAFVIGSYLSVAIIGAMAALAADKVPWSLLATLVAAAPVTAPFMLLLTVKPSSSNILSNLEVAERAGVWVIYLGSIFVIHALLCRRDPSKSPRSGYVLAATFAVTLTAGLGFGMRLNQRLVAEHDYYPQYTDGGYADRNGNLVVKGQFVDKRVFSDGLAAVSVHGRSGFINLKGEMVIPPQYEEAIGFDEGLGRVKSNGKIGFIDRQGNMVIEPQFDAADGFSDGLAAICVGDKWGYIDHSGKIVIAPQFQEARPFSEGLAAAMIDGKNGYIDPTGSFVITSNGWAMPQEFHWGSAKVMHHTQWRRIDWRGEFVE